MNCDGNYDDSAIVSAAAVAVAVALPSFPCPPVGGSHNKEFFEKLLNIYVYKSGAPLLLSLMFGNLFSSSTVAAFLPASVAGSLLHSPFLVAQTMCPLDWTLGQTIACADAARPPLSTFFR